jgi:hypothetical protein
MKEVTLDHVKEYDTFGEPPLTCGQPSAGTSSRDDSDTQSEQLSTREKSHGKA